MTTSVQLPPLPAVRPTHAIPALRYTDAPAAITWLVEVLGAEARHVYPGPDGTVAHAELWLGDACVMLGSFRADAAPPTRPGEGMVYVVAGSADAVDARHARAVAAGARIVTALHDTDYGSRDFACADPEGNWWAFGSYTPPTVAAPVT